MPLADQIMDLLIARVLLDLPKPIPQPGGFVVLLRQPTGDRCGSNLCIIRGRKVLEDFGFSIALFLGLCVGLITVVRPRSS